MIEAAIAITLSFILGFVAGRVSTASKKEPKKEPDWRKKLNAWRIIKVGDIEGMRMEKPDGYELTCERVTYRCRDGISPKYFEWHTVDGVKPTAEVHRKLSFAVSTWRDGLGDKTPLWS